MFLLLPSLVGIIQAPLENAKRVASRHKNPTNCKDIFLGYQSHSGDICFDKTVFTGPKLQFRETVELDLEIWQQGNDFRLECLMWCAPTNGQLPTKKPAVTVDSEELLRTARHFIIFVAQGFLFWPCHPLCGDLHNNFYY